MNELFLRANGTETRYTVTSAGFSLADDGMLSLSVQSDLCDEDDEESPREIYFSIEDCPFNGTAQQIRVSDTHDWTDKRDGPHAYVYSGFHHQRVAAQVDIKSSTKTELEIEFQIVTDDVEFYDERASESGIVGRCLLKACDKARLWIPA